MPALIAACLARAQRHRAGFLLFFCAVILVCGGLFLSLAVREDLRALIPDDDPRLARGFAALRYAPFLQTIAITVGGKGTDPQALANGLAGALEREGMPFAASGPGLLRAAADLPSLLPYLPALLPPDAVTGLAEELNAETIGKALRADKRQLLGPTGPALRSLVAADPLRLHEMLFKKLRPEMGAGAVPVRNGYFTDASGDYCMVVTRPSGTMTDMTASTAAMDAVRAAVAQLPRGTEVFVTGSYRHSEANAGIIKADIKRVFGLSLFLLVLLFAVFLRSGRALMILAVPLSALCVAATATALTYGAVSGIVIGFGSVILGITADYAIHAYYAVTRAYTVEEGMVTLCRPLLAGACTTGFAFAALFFSGIPAIRQIGLFGLVGVVTALSAAILVLPLVLKPRGKEAGSPARAGAVRLRPRLAAAVFIPLSLCILAGAFVLRFDGDIRNLSSVTADIVEDERRAKAIWNLPGEGSFIVAAGDGTDEGFEQALRTQDRIRSLLREAGVAASGIGALLPSQALQAQSMAAWKTVWREHGERILADLDRTGAELGFAAGAFASFRDWIAGEPLAITPGVLDAQGLRFLISMFSSRTEEHSLLYTVLSAETAPDAALVQSIRDAGAEYISAGDFRNTMAAAIGGDIFRFCLLTVLAVVLAVLFVFRSPSRCLAVLLPMLAGLASTLLLFAASGKSVNMFHAVALPLVIALSVDYGIFMQAVIEGSMDGHGAKAVLLSALTTLAGFGSLLSAGHPVLHSLGLAVTTGIAAAMAAALLAQPLLFTKGEDV